MAQNGEVVLVLPPDDKSTRSDDWRAHLVVVDFSSKTISHVTVDRIFGLKVEEVIPYDQATPYKR